jgi:hypothetical protein
MRKSDIINLINRKYGLRRFLEISTPTTGFAFADTDAAMLEVCHRLVYNCGETEDDGLPYTFRTSAPYSYELIGEILAKVEGGPCYDSIFVDSFHTYKCSHTDLSGAFALLKPSGVMVVHDCGPTDPDIAGPKFRKGNWCGVTHAAFIDFVLGRSGLSYYTVDCDYGCGVIHKHPGMSPIRARSGGGFDQLLFRWDSARHQNKTRFQFYQRHRTELLNLVSEADFLS